MTFNEHDHPRAAAGEFTVKQQSAAEIDLAARNPGASPEFLAHAKTVYQDHGVFIETSPVPVTWDAIQRDSATYEWERKRLMTAVTGFGPGGVSAYRSIQPDEQYYRAHGVIVTDTNGWDHLVTTRADAAIEVAARITAGEGWRIQPHILAQATGLRMSLFEILADSDEHGGPEILDLIKRLANGGPSRIADAISGSDEQLAPWFGATRINRLGATNNAGWQTIAIPLPDPNEVPY
jgi:hypothetical protein